MTVRSGEPLKIVWTSVLAVWLETLYEAETP